jgi:hypothetical protein
MAGVVLAVMDVFGFLFSGALGVLQILPLADSPNADFQSTVRIAAGLADSPKLGGDVPGITVWNELGTWLGHVGLSGMQVQAGSFVDIVVPQTQAGAQPTFLRVEGGSNSVCVAYIGHVWPDGQKLGWLGDMGKLCGQQYYYSSLFVTESNGTHYTVQQGLEVSEQTDESIAVLYLDRGQRDRYELDHRYDDTHAFIQRNGQG